MRMPANLYAEMRDRIKAGNVDVAAYRESLMPYTGKDIDKRVRWDLLYAYVGSRWICDNVYTLGMDDSHVDTAMRRIVSELETA